MKQSILVNSARAHLREAQDYVNQADSALEALRDKTTVYAKDVQKLAAAHRNVVRVWEQALKDAGEEI